jgi:hypothetical protein
MFKRWCRYDPPKPHRLDRCWLESKNAGRSAAGVSVEIDQNMNLIGVNAICAVECAYHRGQVHKVVGAGADFSPMPIWTTADKQSNCERATANTTPTNITDCLQSTHVLPSSGLRL